MRCGLRTAFFLTRVCMCVLLGGAVDEKGRAVEQEIKQCRALCPRIAPPRGRQDLSSVSTLKDDASSEQVSPERTLTMMPNDCLMEILHWDW